MPIYRDKARGQFVFEFDRRIAGVRYRPRRRLPKAWSRAEADAYDRKEVARIYAEASGIAPRERPAIERAVELYLTDKAGAKRIGETTRELARIFWAYRGRAFDELPDVARKIAAHGVREGWTPATVRNRIAYLRAACRWAWKRHDMGEHDPGSRIVVPAVRNERSNFLTRAEVLRGARRIRHRDTRACVLIAFYSGMRLDEVIRARPEPGVWVVPDTKNGDDAYVPILAKVAVYARRWPRGVSRNTVQAYVRIAFNAIDRRDASFHTLRHSTATAILAAGESLDVVGDVLRHRDTRSTKRYAHRQREQLAAAMSRGLGEKSPSTSGGTGQAKAA